MCDRKAYRIVESSEDDAGGSDDEWLPGKEGLANASSSDSGAEDVPSDRAQGQKKSRHV